MTQMLGSLEAAPASKSIVLPRHRQSAQSLPFRVRIVRNEEQLSKAVHIRAEAYQRHWPNLYPQLQHPEEQDRNPNSLIFLAERKDTGAACGTMRVDTNLVTPLAITTTIALPDRITSRTIAYVTRLGVKQGKIGSLVKVALFKSLHRYCLAKQVHWMIVGVRPPNDRDYTRLAFTDVYEKGKLVPIFSSGGVPVRVMAFEVMTAERRWFQSGNPFYKFMFEDYHPDIEVFSSVNGMWGQPRRRGTRAGEATNLFFEIGIPVI